MSENIVNELLEHFASEISEEVHKYARDIVLIHSRYLFVEKGRNPEAYCTHCKHQYFERGVIKTGTAGVCPNCKSHCTYKHAWRSRKTLFDQSYFLHFEKSTYDPDVVTATWYYAINDLRGHFHNKLIDIKAAARYVFDCNVGKSYLLERGWGENWTIHDNIVTPYTLRNNNIRRSVHEGSIRRAVTNTKLNYSCWTKYACADAPKYFAAFLKYPSIEILTKAGEIEIVQRKIYGDRTYSAVNWHATKLHNIFKVSKDDYQKLKASNASLFEFWIWQQTRKEKSKLKIADVMQKADTFRGSLDEFKFIRQYTTIHKIFNYVYKQFQLHEKRFRIRNYVITVWRDYINDCIKLQLDLRDEAILFPKDLEDAHQKTMKRIKHTEDELMRKKALKRKQLLEHIEFQQGDYIIKVPNTAKEIIAEGSKLSHCVGGYAERHVNGKTTILFLRVAKEPDKPFYTIELDTDKKKILQVRGYKNKPAPKEVDAFIELFKAEKLNKSKAKARKQA